MRPAPIPATGIFDAGTHHFPLRVYFEDTDLSGVVYHANYLRYMERARSDMLRLAGIDQRGNHEAGTGVYAIATLALAYRRPAKLDDDLIVRSRINAFTAATCTIHQTVLRGDEILTDGDVTAAWISPAGRPQRQPKAWTEIFKRLSQGEELTQ